MKDKILLLVEDAAIIALAEKMSLEKLGYNVIHVDTGEKAIDNIKTYSEIDIVLMDIDLGIGIDGIEAAKRILQIKTLPLIFLTNNSEQKVRKMAESISSYGYLSKDTDIKKIDNKIRNAVRTFEFKSSFIYYNAVREVNSPYINV